VESSTASVDDDSPGSKAAPLPPGDDGVGMDVDKSADGEGKDTKETKDAHPPVKKYKMTEAMKGLIWNLVCLSNECCRIENEKKYVVVHLVRLQFTDRTFSLSLYGCCVAHWKAGHHK
jgi:hypothetical protein